MNLLVRKLDPQVANKSFHAATKDSVCHTKDPACKQRSLQAAKKIEDLCATTKSRLQPNKLVFKKEAGGILNSDQASNSDLIEFIPAFSLP